MSRRLQARRHNGRFTRNTTENTFGFHTAVCPHADCRRFTTWNLGTEKPTTCHACGRPLEDADPLRAYLGRSLTMATEDGPLVFTVAKVERVNPSTRWIILATDHGLGATLTETQFTAMLADGRIAWAV